MIKKLLFILIVIVVSQYSMYSQCNINNFTATPLDATCVQNGEINVQVTGATDCSSAPVFAYIRLAQTSTDLDFITLSSTGTGTFFNLAPNTYDVILQQGSMISQESSITVGSSYEPMSLMTTSSNTTCSSSDTNNPNDGSLSVSVTGGIGPFTYNLLLAGSIIQTSGSTAVTSYTFSNLIIGDYSVSVTDNSPSCSSQEIRSVTIAETSNTPIAYRYERTRPDEDECGKVTYRIAITGGNAEVIMGDPYAASATLNGGATIYGSAKNSTVFDFTGLTPGDILTNILVTDGCNIATREDITIPDLPEDYLDVDAIASRTASCEDGVNILIDGLIDDGLPPGRAAFTFQESNSVSLYKEDPAGSGIFQLLETVYNSVYLVVV